MAWFNVIRAGSQAGNALGGWHGLGPQAPAGVNSNLHLAASGGTTTVNVSGQYFGPASDLSRLLAPLTAVDGAFVSAANYGYLQAQVMWAGCSHISLTACHTQGTRPGGTLMRDSFQAKSDYVATPLPAAARQALVGAAEQRLSSPGHGAILFDCYGGAINRVKPAATAFVHRDVLFCVQYLSYGGGASWLRSTAAAMRPYVTGGAYFNYTDPGLSGWQTAYYGSNYGRLLAIRRDVDPHHYFNFPQAIGR